MPAVTIIIALSSIRNESDFAILASSVPKASAARGTVALETSNSKILSSIPKDLKYSLTLSIAIIFLLDFYLLIIVTLITVLVKEN